MINLIINDNNNFQTQIDSIYLFIINKIGKLD